MSEVQPPSLYEILGVAEDATNADIKSAFRKLAVRYHPDRNPDGTDVFIRIQRAYEVLSDDKMRKIYDRYGEEWIEKFEHLEEKGLTKTWLSPLQAWPLFLSLYVLVVLVQHSSFSMTILGIIFVLLALTLLNPIRLCYSYWMEKSMSSTIQWVIISVVYTVVATLLLYFIIPAEWLQWFTLLSLLGFGLLYINMSKIQYDYTGAALLVFYVHYRIDPYGLSGWGILMSSILLAYATPLIILISLYIFLVPLDEVPSRVFYPLYMVVQPFIARLYELGWSPMVFLAGIWLFELLLPFPSELLVWAVLLVIGVVDWLSQAVNRGWVGVLIFKDCIIYPIAIYFLLPTFLFGYLSRAMVYVILLLHWLGNLLQKAVEEEEEEVGEEHLEDIDGDMAEAVTKHSIVIDLIQLGVLIAVMVFEFWFRGVEPWPKATTIGLMGLLMLLSGLLMQVIQGNK